MVQLRHVPHCLHLELLLKSNLTFLPPWPCPAPRWLGVGPSSHLSQPRSVRGAGLQQRKSHVPKTKTKVSTHPQCSSSTHPVFLCPQPPQKPTGHWSLRPKMSQGRSEGFSWGTGISLHAKQGLYLILTSAQPPWPTGARAASPAGGVEPPVSQPRQPWKCLLSRALLTPNTLQSLLPKGSPCRCLGMELGARTAQAAEVDPVPASPCPAVHSTLSFQRSNRNRSFSPGLRPQGILRGYQEASCKPPSFSSCM